ncbi:MAG: glycosyltransferase 87 family protein [Thermoplasmatota archaeon]
MGTIGERRWHPERALLTSFRDYFRARPRWIYGVAFILQLAIAPFLIHDWDGFVFIESLRQLLHGVTPYQLVENGPSYAFVGDAWPVVNSWYAYPPLPLLLMLPGYFALTLFSHAPWVERLAVKLPFIVGNLVFAWLAARLTLRLAEARGLANAGRWARGAEIAVLFNPFFIFVAAAWGMFDVFILVFLAASLLMLLDDRLAEAGVFFALAALVKPFPAFMVPALAVYLFRRRGGLAAVLRFGIPSFVVAVVVCLPFFVAAPAGFIEQVVSIHAARPPQGFALVSIPLAFASLNQMYHLHLPENIDVQAITSVSFFLLAAVSAVFAVVAARAKDEVDLLAIWLGVIVGVLLVNKVVNEQYLLLPLGLLILLCGVTRDRWHRAGVIAFSFGGFVSAFFLGWHFLTFIPPDIAPHVLAGDPDGAASRVQSALGLTDFQGYILPTIIGALALIPALLVSIVLVGRGFRDAARAIEEGFPRFSSLPASRALVAVALAIAFIVPPWAGALAVVREDTGVAPSSPPLTAPPHLVGTFYYLWWNNPAHDPGVLYGNWKKGVSEVSVDGYYSVNPEKLRQDFRAMKAHGIDLVVVSLHDYDRPKLPTLMRVAAEEKMLVAPLVELGDVIADPTFQARGADGAPLGADHGYALTLATRNAMEGMISSMVTFFGEEPATYRVDGKPAVFLYDSGFAGFDASPEFQDAAARAAVRILERDAHDPAAPRPLSFDALRRAIPASARDVQGAGALNATFREAFQEVFDAFWSSIRTDVESRHGPLWLVSGEHWNPELSFEHDAFAAYERQRVFNDSFIYSPSFAWVFHREDSFSSDFARWRTENAIEAQYERGLGRPVIMSVAPGYDDRPLRTSRGFKIPYTEDGIDTYDAMWSEALTHRPDVVLIATWNEFYEGTGIEPTVQFGSHFLDRTSAWARTFNETKPASARALVITDARGSRLDPESGDPDWTVWFSPALQTILEGELTDTAVSALDVDSQPLNATDLSAFSLVVAEPGSNVVRTNWSRDLPERLADFASAGGHVMVLGGNIGPHYDRLVRLGSPVPWKGAANLTDGRDRFPMPTDDRTWIVTLAPGNTPYLWLMNATGGRVPAAWLRPVGLGIVAATSFRPQGDTPFPSYAETNAVDLALAPLMTDGRR